MDKVKTVSTRLFKKWTTKEGILGDYDYGYLFIPQIPFTKTKPKIQPFFGLQSDMPLLLGALLGFQHALAMLAGVVTPPLIISSVANLGPELQKYLVSVSLIVTGLMSLIQITRFHIYKTPYYIGTGLISVVGTSFATITIISQSLPMLYADGTCPTIDGVPQACPDGYGKILGTAMVCALIEVLGSFTPSRVLQKIFPPLITGSVVFLIGAHLIHSGFNDWLGGSSCAGGECPSNHGTTNTWGSAQFVGLGFTVYATIILSERFGSPIMKSCAVIIGLLVGCIVGAATGYFNSSQIDNARSFTFMWVYTFKLGFLPQAVLPFLMVYLVLMMEAIGDITATAELSKIPLEGENYESRIQGGILADGLFGVITGLMTLTPVSTFSQNNGVISVTKCANRRAGYWCCFFLIIMGVFSKFAAVIVSIPKPILGGMTSFLFASVAVSGLKIVAECDFSRRDRFILTAILLPGMAAILIEGWFDNVFTYDGGNEGLKGFFQAITLVMNSGYAIAGFLGVIINLLIPQLSDEEEATVEEVNEVVVESGSDNVETYETEIKAKSSH